MTDPASRTTSPRPELDLDLALLDEPTIQALPPAGGTGFDADTTMHFKARMSKAPVWFCSFVASNKREKHRFRDELALMKGAWPLLMKQRSGGGKWTDDDKVRLKAMVRSASSVSPYLFIWAIPGSMILLPFLAWFLDRQRKSRAARAPR